MKYVSTSYNLSPLVGGHCNDHIYLSNIMCIPLIRCSSYRLNLWVQSFLRDQDILKTIEDLKIKLRISKIVDNLKKVIKLRSIR